MSSPYIAGAWAMMRHAYPEKTIEQIQDRLASSETPVQHLRNGVVKTRLQLDAALSELVSPTCPADVNKDPADALAALNQIEQSAAIFDLDQSGQVDEADVQFVLDQLGEFCDASGSDTLSPQFSHTPAVCPYHPVSIGDQLKRKVCMLTMSYRWLLVLVAIGAMATVLPGAMAQPPACGFMPTRTIRGTDTLMPGPQSTVAILQPGQVYPVVAVRGNRVNVAIDDAFGVWVPAIAGTLRGDCNSVAAPTALALNGARLWSEPDVRTGQVIAAVPAQTALIVINGPVNGPIRLDTDATGDWYFVQVSSTAQGGWLWQARLQFTN